MNRFHPELDSISALLAALGNPEKKLKIIHVVGTNGKGSVSNMLGGIFTSYGLKTGLFTSPYITELTEYIHVDGNEISKEHFARIAEKLFVICVKEGIYPSHFEFVTVVSILYFIEKNCDICIY
jgi:dihydrofolate synthase/folylpolyglutamate synthase